MPRQAKKVPRPCPLCAGLIRQKYFKTCGRCRARARRRKKEERRLRRVLAAALS